MLACHAMGLFTVFTTLMIEWHTEADVGYAAFCNLPGLYFPSGEQCWEPVILSINLDSHTSDSKNSRVA